MVVDGNLFTLTFERRNEESNILDLIPFSSYSSSEDQKPLPLYTISRAKSNHYSIRLIDFSTEIVLCSIDCPASIDKLKSIHLHNPDEEILLEKKGMTFKQDWRWKWEKNEFCIRKEGRSFMIETIRKPDPEIIIAQYTPQTKIRPGTLQILDYNIQRLDVEDRRGLEILMIAATCHLLDQEYDEAHKDSINIHQAKVENIAESTISIPTTKSDNEELIEHNEIIIDHHVPDSSYIEHALKLLRQDEMGEGLHMIIIRANSTQLAQRAVRIAAEIKARWYKLPALVKGRTLDPMPGNNCEIAEELYQYVRDPELLSQKQQTLQDPTAGPRGRIKLGSPNLSPPNTSSNNSSKDSKHSPNRQSFLPAPSRLHIYLSKDRIDEFERSRPSSSAIQTEPRPTTPAKRPPNIPPKTISNQGNAHQDGSESSGAKRLLGKLGLRKSDS